MMSSTSDFCKEDGKRTRENVESATDGTQSLALEQLVELPELTRRKRQTVKYVELCRVNGTGVVRVRVPELEAGGFAPHSGPGPLRQ